MIGLFWGLMVAGLLYGAAGLTLAWALRRQIAGKRVWLLRQRVPHKLVWMLTVLMALLMTTGLLVLVLTVAVNRTPA